MLLLAQTDDTPIEFSLAPLFEEHGIALAVMGVVVVFLALILVVVFITLLPRLLARLSPAPPTTQSTEELIDDGITEETIVVIAAAVASVLDRPHRVVRVRGLTPEDLGWSLEGRIKHHHSHTIPHRDSR